MSLLAAPTASADVVTQCAGTRAWSGPVESGDQEAGRLEFWKGSSGRKCVMLYDLAAGSHPMEVVIEKMDCNRRRLTAESDSGMFEYYAGGAQVQGPDAGRMYEIRGVLHYGGRVFVGTRLFNTGC